MGRETIFEQNFLFYLILRVWILCFSNLKFIPTCFILKLEFQAYVRVWYSPSINCHFCPIFRGGRMACSQAEGDAPHRVRCLQVVSRMCPLHVDTVQQMSPGPCWPERVQYVGAQRYPVHYRCGTERGTWSPPRVAVLEEGLWQCYWWEINFFFVQF